MCNERGVHLGASGTAVDPRSLGQASQQDTIVKQEQNQTVRGYIYARMDKLNSQSVAMRDLLNSLPASYLDSPKERLTALDH